MTTTSSFIRVSANVCPGQVFAAGEHARARGRGCQSFGKDTPPEVLLVPWSDCARFTRPSGRGSSVFSLRPTLLPVEALTPPDCLLVRPSPTPARGRVTQARPLALAVPQTVIPTEMPPEAYGSRHRYRPIKGRRVHAEPTPPSDTPSLDPLAGAACVQPRRAAVPGRGREGVLIEFRPVEVFTSPIDQQVPTPTPIRGVGRTVQAQGAPPPVDASPALSAWHGGRTAFVPLPRPQRQPALSLPPLLWLTEQLASPAAFAGQSVQGHALTPRHRAPQTDASMSYRLPVAAALEVTLTPAWAVQQPVRSRGTLGGTASLALSYERTTADVWVVPSQIVSAPAHRQARLTGCVSYAIPDAIVGAGVVVGGPYWVAAGGVWAPGAVEGDVLCE